MKILFILEVKIMSIPKIAISNENDSSLRIVENRSKPNINSNTSSPYKSIMKTRPSHAQSTSSSTTQSYYTCNESIGKQSSKIPTNLKRSQTASTMKNGSNHSLHEYYSIIKLDNQQSKNSIYRIRRINSYQSLKNNSILDSEKPIKEDITMPNIKVKRRLTIDHIMHPMIEVETSSIYETPKHEYNQRAENSIRLIVDTDSNLSTISSHIDMQVNHKKSIDQLQIEVNI